MIHKWQYINTPKLCIVTSLHAIQYYDFSALIFTGIVIIKKYYNELLTSLPHDYMIMMQQLFKLSTSDRDDRIVPMADLIITCSNLQESMLSKTILDLLIIYAKNDYRLLGFSYLLENFIQDSKSSVIESFRNGRLNTIVINDRL